MGHYKQIDCYTQSIQSANAVSCWSKCSIQ